MADSKVTVLKPRQQRRSATSTQNQPTPDTETRPKPTPKRNRRKSRQASSRKTLGVFRVFLIWLVLFAGAGGLTWNLYQLQVVRSPLLKKKAQQQHKVYMRPYVPRRPIIDRNGNVLATDRLVYTLYAHPSQFNKSGAEIASQLDDVLEQDISVLLKKFDRGKTGIPIAYGLSEDLADKVAKLSFDGLELIQQYSRLYPQQELASEVVGYVDLDHRGQAGLEYSQQSLLERNVKTLNLNKAGNGSLIPAYLPEGFLEFDHQKLQLTLDSRLQRLARSQLKATLDQYNAKRGAVIVMDVNDGSLLTLACEPTFDPNEYSKFDVKLFKSWAVTDLYEPGSTFKPINVAIALEKKAIQPDDSFYDSGILHYDQWEITNHDFDEVGGRGSLNLSQILAYSSNVAMVHLIQKLDRREYYEALQNLDITETTGVELPGEGRGQLKPKEEFVASVVEVATASFGQGFSLTPLKLAQLHAAIANGGKLVTPHLIQGLVDPEGKIQKKYSPAPGKRIFSKETTQIILEKMEDVVEAEGGRNARVEGYRIAGKSGTSQKATAEGGYDEDAKVVSFVASFPVADPQYLVLAVIDEPQGGEVFGSTVAAPIVKTMVEAVITLQGIPPS